MRQQLHSRVTKFSKLSGILKDSLITSIYLAFFTKKMPEKVIRHPEVIFMTRVCLIKKQNQLHGVGTHL